MYIDSVSYIPITTTYSKSSSLEYSPFIIKPSAYLSKHSGTGCPGSGVSSTSNGGEEASIGYLATYWNGSSTEVGFVTAGHAIGYSATTFYDSNGDVLGTKSYNYGPSAPGGLTNLPDVDVAFVKLNSNATLTRTIANTSYKQSSIPIIPAENSTVYLSGAISNLRQGSVVSLYFNTGTEIDNYETQMRRLLTSISSAPGDSGGIIFTAPVNGYSDVVGIHQGGGTINGATRSVEIFAFKIADHNILVR